MPYGRDAFRLLDARLDFLQDDIERRKQEFYEHWEKKRYAERMTIKCVRPILPIKIWDGVSPPEIQPMETYTVTAVYDTGVYRVADIRMCGEYCVISDNLTTHFRTTDLELAKMVADSFTKEGV